MDYVWVQYYRQAAIYIYIYKFFKDTQTLAVGLLNVLCMEFSIFKLKYEIIHGNTDFISCKADIY